MEVKDKWKAKQKHHLRESAQPLLREANHDISLQLVTFLFHILMHQTVTVSMRFKQNCEGDS